MSDLATYEGGCHCGAVRYRVQLPPIDKVYRCNCSMCSRMGWQLAFTPATGFELLSGEDALRDYRFNQEKIRHLFCGTCGIRSFARGPGHDGTDWVSINLNCVDDLDLEGLPVEFFDGASL